MRPLSPRSVGLLLGYAADRTFGDPVRHHPVAWFGTAAGRVEQALYQPQRRSGAAFTAVTVLPCVLGAVLAERGGPLRRTLVTATATWVALGGRSLEREALAVHELLTAENLPGARVRIRSLVGRDTAQATATDLARAVVESLAENQSDAVAATLVWGALLGAPGIVLHRCANTLDAMVGHRSPRYHEFGWVAARVDDLLNWVPSRVSVLATAAATVSPSRAREVIQVARTDGPQHPSPNAGPVEAAAASALGVQLGGTNSYGNTVEDRGRLGSGRPVAVGDIPRAVRLERRVGLVVLAAAVLGGTLVRSGGFRQPGDPAPPAWRRGC